MKSKKLSCIRILYCLTFGIAAFMHFYNLGNVPYGIHIDEAGMAYDAYCLANYSVDRYLNYLPVYLINFGGGQSALNAYLVALLIKITGEFNVWIIRIPGAVIGMFAWFAGVKIIRKCMGEKWGLLAAFFLAIFPYFSMQSRFGLDCNLLLGISTVGVYLLLLVDDKKKTVYFILAGLVWGICYYTYALSYIGNTLFLAAVLLYWLYYKRITWRQCFCFGIPVVLLAFPLLMVIIVNSFGLSKIEIGSFTIPVLPNYRGSELIFTELWSNFCIIWQSILSHDWLPYNALDHFYTMYGLSIPFILLGVVQMFKDMKKTCIDKNYSVNMIFLFLLCSWLVVGMMLGGNGPNINKLNGIFFAVFYCLLYGMKYIWLSLNQFLRSQHAKERLPQIVRLCSAKVLALMLLLLYLVDFVSFADTYFNKYPVEEYPQYLFADTYEDILEFIESEIGEVESVYVDDSYIYYLLSAKVNPYELTWNRLKVQTHWKYSFALSNEIYEDCIYIVRETNEEYIKKLKEYPFEVYHSGMYNCYYMK